MSVIEEIAAERARQIEKEGWSLEHDDEAHYDGSLSMAAACYAAPEPIFRHGERRIRLNSARGIDENCYQYDYETVTDYHDPWPWDCEWDKRGSHSRRRQLVVAAALIVAEIERLDRET